MSDLTKKAKLPKVVRSAYFTSQFEVCKAGIITPEQVKNIIISLDHKFFLTMKEAEDIIMTTEMGEDFIDFLNDVEAIKAVKEGRVSTERLTRINSLERALQVVKNEEDAQKFADFITQIIEIKKQASELLDPAKGNISLAIRNAREAVVAEGEEAEVDSNS